MEIAGYTLKNGDDPRQIITFKRKKIDESGKKDVRFLVWDSKNPKFGISDEHYEQVAGISVRENKKIIQAFLNKVIKTGEAKTCYQYIGATEEAPEGGFISEVIPIVCETKKYDQSVIPELKKMKEIIDSI
jgi:hypothetical protein